MNAYWLLLINLSFLRDSLAKAQSRNVFGQCSSSLSYGVWQNQCGSVWQLMASVSFTGCLCMLGALAFRKIRTVCRQQSWSNNWKLLSVSVEGLVVGSVCFAHMEGKDLVANVLWELSVFVQPARSGRCRTWYLSRFFCFIHRLHGDCLTFRQSLSR